MDNVKQPPTFNSKGTPCNIVDNCTSGKPALYIVGKLYACIEHKDVAYEMAKKRRTPEPEPEVDSFVPEIEAVEVEEVEVGRFAQPTVDD